MNDLWTKETSEPSAVPFLITLWLSKYSCESENDRNVTEARAVQRIRSATFELAQAFAELGAFGTTMLGRSFLPTENGEEDEVNQLSHHLEFSNASFSTLLNRFNYQRHNKQDLLESIVASSDSLSRSIANGDAAEAHWLRPLLRAPTLLQAAPANTTPLPVQDTSVDVIIAAAKASRRYTDLRWKEEQDLRPQLHMLLRSKRFHQRLLLQPDTVRGPEIHRDVSQRVLLQLNHGLEDLASQRKQLDQDKLMALNILSTLWTQAIYNTTHFSSSFSLHHSNSINDSTSVCATPSNTKKRIPNGLLQTLFSRQYIVGRSNTTASHKITRVYPPNKPLPLSIASCSTPRSFMGSNSQSMIKTILSSRLSHCTTINAHLSFPVYCFCFDKTGKYFFTGADDHLVKAFYLLSPSSQDLEESTQHNLSGEDPFLSPSKRSNYGESITCPKSRPYIRGGAVLVATLRGHAGVINDMDVAVDNSMLASASEDGDVRVWTLHGSHRTTMGVPVAILRGHVGGANMVAWSNHVPYQLVTTAQDGWARVWDVRMAAVKRSVHILGTRLDYSWISAPNNYSVLESLSSKRKEDAPMNEHHDGFGSQSKENEKNKNHFKTNGLTDEDMEKGCSSNDSTALNMKPKASSFTVALDTADGDLSAQRQQDVPVAIGEQLPLGAFVSNAVMDHGVVLVTKMFHGDVSSAAVESSRSVHTRSRVKSVSVICLSRCPLGGHFATGCDDGIGRVWLDTEDSRIEKLDSHLLAQQRVPRIFTNRYTTNRRIETDTLLATLSGHLNAITDIRYSFTGDRLLTASQKDGVVRIWSWGFEPNAPSDASNTSMKLSNLQQIIIRLTKNPSTDINNSLLNQSTGHSKGRGVNSTSNHVLCDVAIWSSDDSKIITSQYSPLRSTGVEAVPGSQVILIWDSFLGTCLMGLNAAHSAGCPVLISHPLDPTILVSAGSDGYVRVWDIECGSEIFSHFNSLEHGPIEQPLVKGQPCGYLDGDFSDDGLILILTDDVGRICIIDAFVDSQTRFASADQLTNSPLSVKQPTWMKEQYFANDYYDLFYDTSGYSVEQGSGQPTHLAPRAARCNHNGVPYPERIQDSFLRLGGPMPLKAIEVRTARESLRIRGSLIRKPGGMLEKNVEGKRPMIVSTCTESTNYVGRTMLPPSVRRTQLLLDATVPTGNDRRVSFSDRTLSANYRWRGYEEEDDIEFDELDEDDEEYNDNPARNPANESPDDDDVISLDADSVDSLILTRSQRRRDNLNSSRSYRDRRASRQIRRILDDEDEDEDGEEDQEDEEEEEVPPRVRGIKHNLRESVNRRFKYDDPDSSDEEIEEFLSCSKGPVGEFVEDYTILGHFFKMPSKGKVHRKWVSRTESATGFTGQRPYCPQVGDSVVYIPRAHYDTLRTFPNANSTSAPWKLFPFGSMWPAVRCMVKDLRYRFPYEIYYRSNGSTRVTSVVIILSLEITGIPDTTHQRPFPWPKPKFISPTVSEKCTFEVSLFSNGEVEFLLPEALYIWRLASLEQMIRIDKRIDGLLIHTHYDESEGKEDDDHLLVPYPGEIVFANRSCDSEPHFQNSGYDILTIRFPHNDLYARVGVWEISPAAGRYNGPRPQTLDRDQKAAIQKIIDDLEENPEISLYFSHPVDYTRYVDYLSMIEVPMDLSFIKKRLKNDYYSNILSVSADIRLIRDNCFKYNESDSVISMTAKEMYDTFMQRFDEVVTSEVGQRQPTLDRHLPTIPDENEDIVILFEPGLETSVSAVMDAPVINSVSPSRRSTRSSSTIDELQSEHNNRSREGDNNHSIFESHRVSERRSRVREIQTLPERRSTRSQDAPIRNSDVDGQNTRQGVTSSRGRETQSFSGRRLNTRSQDAPRRIGDVDGQNTRLSRTSNTGQQGYHGRTIVRPDSSGREVQNSRTTRSSHSNDIIPARQLRSMGTSTTSRSSIWDTGRDLSSNSTVIRIRLTPTRGRTRGHEPATDSIPSNMSPDLNMNRISRIRTRSAVDHSPSVLTQNFQLANSMLENPRSSRRISRSSADHSTEPLINSLPSASTDTANKRSTRSFNSLPSTSTDTANRRSTRSFTPAVVENRRTSRDRPAVHSPSVLINIASSPSTEPRRVTRSSIVKQSQDSAVNGKKRRVTNIDFNFDDEETPQPKRSKLALKKKDNRKMSSKVIEEEIEMEDESSHVDDDNNRKPSFKKKAAMNRWVDSDASFDSSEEEEEEYDDDDEDISHSGRRPSRQTSRKKVSYKDRSDSEDSDDSDVDMKSSIRRKLSGKRGRT